MNKVMKRMGEKLLGVSGDGNNAIFCRFIGEVISYKAQRNEFPQADANTPCLTKYQLIATEALYAKRYATANDIEVPSFAANSSTAEYAQLCRMLPKTMAKCPEIFSQKFVNEYTKTSETFFGAI